MSASAYAAALAALVPETAVGAALAGSACVASEGRPPNLACRGSGGTGAHVRLPGQQRKAWQPGRRSLADDLGRDGMSVARVL